MDQLHKRSTEHESEANVTEDQNDTNPQPKLIKQEEKKYLPVTNITKIMRSAIGGRGRISEDSKEMVQDCVSEFIRRITTVAKKKCHNDYRNIITADDLIYSMASLGFDNYAETLGLYLDKMRETNAKGGSTLRLATAKRQASASPPKSRMVKPSPQLQSLPLPSNNYSVKNGAIGEGESSSGFKHDKDTQFK